MLSSPYFRTLALPGFALAAALLLAPAAAQGADYDAYYCSGPNGEPLLLNDWVAPAGGLVGNPSNSCGAQGGAFSVTRANQTTFINGDRTAWKLTAPDALSIVGVGGDYNVQGRMTHTAAQADGISACVSWNYDVYPPETRGTDQFQGFILNCPDSDGFSESQPVKPLSGPMPSISTGITCAAPGGQTCQEGPVTINNTRYIVRFRDLDAPVPGLPVQGDLVAGGTLSGTRTVQATLRDKGSGVRTVRIYFDGTNVSEASGRCSEPYVRAVPCPTDAGIGAAVDTRRLTDGMHQMRIVGVDAAGNEGVLWDAPVLIDNGGARGPGSDPAIRGDLNGTPALDDNRIRAWWPGTARAASKKKSVIKKCKRSAYRNTHRVACNGRPPGQTLRTRFSSSRSSIIRGSLVTATGAPVRGATVRLVATSAAAGAQPRELASVTTNDAGRFEARVPRRDGGQTITAAWFARSRDTNPVGVQTLRIRVTAQTSFRATAKRIRVGKTVRFAGKLTGRAGSSAGSSIVIQASNRGNNWRTAGTANVAATGRWSFRYRVPRALRGTYRFRAVVLPSPSYPYGKRTSTTRRVTVTR
ncbi:unannotated protein [freshwater metagenome]|uniref:Unannotated protein n=1 Tax=freshwater metagenome TaxID=449393 RepID=A0A6J7F9S2_9ZZZZ|nr:hypothetical protein [Actinomycetota bacterium]